jgi:curved DNA-binding protein CbpA
MKSAYQVLGVPANAALEDIEQAFRRAEQHYTPERLASADGAVDRFNEARAAWQLLRDPQTRAAHDRKVSAARASAAPRTPVEPVVEEVSPTLRMLKIGALVMVVLFAAGAYISSRNAERRAAAAAAEHAAAQLRLNEEKERLEAAARVEDQRRADAARAEAAERRLSAESRAIGDQQASRAMRMEAQAAESRRMEANQRAAAQAAEERRLTSEAQRRAEADKQRVRQLCWQNYRTPDC